jgi:Zn-dependent oligopeptidase
MLNPNPLAGVVPQVVHPVNDGETTVSQYVEKIEGEVALDSYVKAQTSAPEVVKRITELENCLQRLASAILTSSDVDKHPELRTAAEQAKLVLKNRLEVDESRHRFHSELRVIRTNCESLRTDTFRGSSMPGVETRWRSWRGVACSGAILPENSDQNRSRWLTRVCPSGHAWKMAEAEPPARARRLICFAED